jgi:hypothetical protein
MSGGRRLAGGPRWQIGKIVRGEFNHSHAGGLGADAAGFAEVPKDRRSGTTGEQRAMKHIKRIVVMGFSSVRRIPLAAF